MRSMDTLREYDEHDAGLDADSGSSSTGRDSIGSAKSLGSARGRGRGHAAVPKGPATAREKEQSHPAPVPAPVALLHRRIASQSRERPELVEIKSASMRGRSTGNWL